MRKVFAVNIFLLILFSALQAAAQISPGKLAAVHSQLEGISNCTSCHTLGDKVTNDKCLACHSEIKARTDIGKGYHSSAEVKGKQCTSCHSDHHGPTFQIIRFDKDKFNHALAGFPLTGAHAKKTCKDCHKPDFISNARIKSKKFTYLGLSTNCMPCHKDYHQNTIKSPCLDCHTGDAFKPASKFSHANTKFPLVGMHETVPCEKCHAVSVKNNVKFQAFAGVPFGECSSCHKDPHHNQFGPNCSECHVATSFHTVKGIANFDHSKTKFPLENRHRSVPCKSCHKGAVTDPLRHDKCTDCHKDYHKGDFTKDGIAPDCTPCHTTAGFKEAAFTLEQHNNGNFKLIGAHVATPCISCHKKQENWKFRNIGLRCIDCHKDVHAGLIDPKFYPENSCVSCHNPNRWSEIKYDHSQTGFGLTGAHIQLGCRSCHFKKDAAGAVYQVFANMDPACTSCHKDNHHRQFEVRGVTECLRCHTTAMWKIPNFDHNKTAYKLDGKHQKVACLKCHKTVTDQNVSYVLYKIKDSKCESCH